MTRDLTIPEQIDMWFRQAAIHQAEGFPDGAAICFDRIGELVYGETPLHELLERLEVPD